jgi:hypothetical protein
MLAAFRNNHTRKQREDFIMHSKLMGKQWKRAHKDSALGCA